MASERMVWNGMAMVALLLSTAAAGLKGQQPFVATDSIRAVAAVGVGATSEAATHAALRSAVEQGVGVFVTSQTRVENDRLIQDRILSMSTGFVRRYQVVETRQGPSGVEVRLLAEVGLTPLREALQAAGVQVQLSGRTLFANLDQEDEKRRQEVQVLSSLFWEDVDRPSAWDFQVQLGTPLAANTGFSKVPLTVLARPNGNYLEHLREALRTLWSVAGPGNRRTGAWQAVPVSPPVRYFIEPPLLQYEQPHRVSSFEGSGFDVFRNDSLCPGRDFACLVSSVRQDATGAETSESEFPAAPYRGGYVVELPGRDIGSVLLRTRASALIVANYLNQTVFHPSYSVVVEREAGGPIRIVRDINRDVCRMEETTSGPPRLREGWGYIPGPWQHEGIAVSRQPEVRFAWNDILDNDRNSRLWRYGALQHYGPGGGYMRLRYTVLSDSSWIRMSLLEVTLPDSVLRQVTGIRIEPSRTRLLRGLRVIEADGGRTVPLVSPSPLCERLRAGLLQ